MEDFYQYEREYWQKGLLLAGADEAGRGPLAGPVVAAAVILPESPILEGVNDSKKLSEKKREKLYAQITEEAVAWSVGIVEQDIIDEINILNAARLAFLKAVEGLKPRPDFVCCDQITGLELPVPHEAIVKGDAKVYSIAAASIVAKVTRDRIMRDMAEQYPQYGFEKHKGYGTRAHAAAILKYGPCPIHRRSFLKKLLGK